MSDVIVPAVPAVRQKLSGLAKWCLFWSLFIGLGALLGVGMMWSTPERFGMDQLLEPMRVLPFGNTLAQGFGWPGVALGLVIGAPHLAAAWLIHKRHPLAPLLVLAAGVILLCWLALQLFVLYGPNPMTNVYLVFAALEILCAALWLHRERQTLRP